MAELTKEKILSVAHEIIGFWVPFEGLNKNAESDHEWLKAVLFFNTGVNEFAKALIKELEGKDG